MALKLQMNWEKSLLKINQKRKKGSPPLGLRNLGNSCYLNSVLQCLTFTPPLANFCLNLQHSSLCDLALETDHKRNCPFCMLERRIVRSLSSNLTSESPLKIHGCLQIFAENFRGGRQEDAHEFLRYVIDACHNACLRLKKLRRKNNGGEPSLDGSTVVKEIFGGTLQSQVKCLSCGNESNKVDDIMDISLDVLHSNSLKDALQKFFQPEVLDGNNKYKCESCKKLVPARKQMSILEAPNVLVIQFKRFEGIFGGKIDKTIAFEEVLVLSSFMCKASKDLYPDYKLCGTIVHSGFSPESGHYYAYIRDSMDRWYCCNDSYVTLSSLQEVLSEKVYILFFSRTKQRPPSTGLSSNGIRPRFCNGNDTTNNVKVAHPAKELSTKPVVENSLVKNFSIASKVDRVQMKFNFGTSDHKRVSATSNGKLDVRKDQSVKNGDAKDPFHTKENNNHTPSALNGSVKNLVHTKENGNTILSTLNGNVKDPVHTKENGSDIPSLLNRNNKKGILSSIDMNGEEKIEKVDSVINSSQLSSLANGHAEKQTFSCNSIKADYCGRNGMESETMGRSSEYQEVQNGGVTCYSDKSLSKRKSHQEDDCILFPQDHDSRIRLQGLKEELQKEASLVLQSCGWSEEVHRFMQSRKRLCAQAGCLPNDNELKKLLISEAKPKFLLQVPQSLKGNLIKQLMSSTRTKTNSGPLN